MPGGQPRAAEGALTGPLTLASLAALRFDTVVVGCCGLTAADGGKLGHTAYAHVDPATLVHTLVTDAPAPADEVTALEAGGAVVRAV